MQPVSPPVGGVPQFVQRTEGWVTPWDPAYDAEHASTFDELAEFAVAERMVRWREQFAGPYPSAVRDALYDAVWQTTALEEGHDPVAVLRDADCTRTEQRVLGEAVARLRQAAARPDLPH